MEVDDLRRKYGAHGDIRDQAFRAVRGEVFGGDDALNAWHYLERLQKKLKNTEHPGAADAQAAFNACRRLVRVMRDVVYDRYRIGLKYRMEDAQNDKPQT